MDRVLCVVNFWNKTKAFGFCETIEDRPSQAFVHITCVEGRRHLLKGDLITCTIVPSKNKPGKSDAIDVRLVKRDEVSTAPAPSAEAVSR